MLFEGGDVHTGAGFDGLESVHAGFNHSIEQAVDVAVGVFDVRRAKAMAESGDLFEARKDKLLEMAGRKHWPSGRGPIIAAMHTVHTSL